METLLKQSLRPMLYLTVTNELNHVHTDSKAKMHLYSKFGKAFCDFEVVVVGYPSEKRAHAAAVKLAIDRTIS